MKYSILVFLICKLYSFETYVLHSKYLDFGGYSFLEFIKTEDSHLLETGVLNVYGKMPNVSSKSQGELSLVCAKLQEVQPKNNICYKKRDELLLLMEKQGVASVLKKIGLDKNWKIRKFALNYAENEVLHLILKKTPFLLTNDKKYYLPQKALFDKGVLQGFQAINLSAQYEYRTLSGVHFPLIKGVSGFKHLALNSLTSAHPLEQVFITSANKRFGVLFVKWDKIK